MPKLWNDTIAAHRTEVTDAIIETTADLVGRLGLFGVTMAKIAEETGIGRATLYKYFADVESIVHTWHARQVARHLEHLEAVRQKTADACARVRDVLSAYALIARESGTHHDSQMAAVMHRGHGMPQAHARLLGIFKGVLREAQQAGCVRTDASAAELASYCVNALAGARTLRSNAAARRLAEVVIAGLAEPRTHRGSRTAQRRKGRRPSSRA